jgi:hypothetical protein
MPMYAGMGNLRQRIKKAASSKRRGEMWDHFSWYILSDAAVMRQIEALTLPILPANLRSLTGQSRKFPGQEGLAAESFSYSDPTN